MMNPLDTDRTPAEKLVMLALEKEPGASVNRLVALTGMELAVVRQTLKLLGEAGR